MRPNAIRWEVPPLSTSSVQAAILYRDGIAALVSGISSAEPLLTEAVELDRAFLLADVGLSVCRVAGGGHYLASTVRRGDVQRGERQHAEVVDTMLGGDGPRGVELRREHLSEYPGDLLIVWLPMIGPAVAR